MNRLMKMCIGLGVFIVMASGAVANARPLSLRGAWERMAKVGPGYAIAQHRHQAAMNDHRSKRLSFYLPKLSFNFMVPSFSNNELNQDIPTGDSLNPYRRELSTSEMTNLSGALSLSQAVFTGGRLEVSGELLRQKRIANLSPDFRSDLGGLNVRFSQPLFQPSTERDALKEARLELRRSDVEYKQARWEALMAVTRAYGGWLMAIQDELAARLEAERTKYEAEAGQAKYEAGSLMEAALIGLQSAALDAEIEHLDATARRKDAETGLAAEIDWPLGDSLVAPDSLPDLDVLLGHGPRLPSGRDSLAAISKAQLDLETSDFRLRQQKSRGGLDGTLNANWSKQQEDETILATDSTSSFNTGRWGVSLQLSIPVWDGGAQRAAVQSAQLAVEESEANLKKARREAENELASARRRFETFRRKLDLKHQEMVIAGRARSTADRKYEDGLLSEAEYLESKVTAVKARRGYLEIKRDYIIAYLEVQNLFVHTVPPL